MSRRFKVVLAAVVALAMAACTNPVAPDSAVPQQPSHDTVVQGSGT
jgi:hypothetical protein